MYSSSLYGRSSPNYPQSNPGPPSDSSSEDSYKDKCEHLVILVQKLQKELQSHRIRDEGIATMTACLQEQKEDNEQLRTKLANCEREKSVLHNRLSSAGLSPHPSLQEGESLLPGPSKQVFDNLVRENARLKQIVKSAKMEPSALEEAQQHITQLQRHLLELTDRNKKLEEAYMNLKQTSMDKSRSKNGSISKESEVSRLHSLVKSLEQTQDAMSTSIPEESENFKKQLQEMCKMCQSLLKNMEQKGQTKTTDIQTSFEQQVQKPVLLRSDSGIGEEEASKLREEITKLKDENYRLNQECKEMLDTNKRWNLYNEQRENYIRQLLTELKQVRTQLEAMTTTPSLSEEQQREFDRLLQISKENVEKVEQEKVKIEDENRELRLQIERLVAEMDRIKSRSGRSTEDQDRIHMLEAQVQICTEDFESERRDRERAQARINEMENEMDLIKRQLEQFQTSHMTHLYNQRMAALSNYQNDYERRYGSSGGNERQLIARGIVQYEADGPNEDDSEGEDTVDLTPRPQTQDSALSHVEGEMQEDCPQPIDALQCPRCKKDFPTDKHNLLLEHIDICCD
jgi:centrosomal protein CEP55